MTTEQLSTVEEKTVEVNYQIQRLARQLCNFANLNPSFKTGRSDYISIEATETERCEPELPEDMDLGEDDEEEGDRDSTVPQATFTYKFEAARERYYIEDGDRRTQKAHVMFIFSVIGVNDGVLMPAHIAENVIGLPPQEAVREIGPVTLKATTMFKLTSGIGHFSVCDNAEYLDLDGDPMHESACSCENNNVLYVTEYDDQGDMMLIDEDGIKQYTSTDLLQKSENEVVTFNDIDSAVDEWRDMIHLGEIIDVEVQQDRLMRARQVLANIQSAIWTQAGMNSEQQKQLRLRLER